MVTKLKSNLVNPENLLNPGSDFYYNAEEIIANFVILKRSEESYSSSINAMHNRSVYIIQAGRIRLLGCSPFGITWRNGSG